MFFGAGNEMGSTILDTLTFLQVTFRESRKFSLKEMKKWTRVLAAGRERNL